MTPTILNVALVFDDWRGPLGAKVGSATYHELSAGSLHSGTTYQATITLDPNTAEDLMDALNAGYQPVFWMGKRKVSDE